MATKALRYAGQAAIYLLIAVILGYFSDSPRYTHLPAGTALIKMSFAHGAERKGECRRLSREELLELPANMRKPVDCPRERIPILLRLSLDGEVIYEAALPPTGLAGDGPSRVYERFVVPAGRHSLGVALRDSGRESGFDYESEKEIDLAPAASLAIGFRAETGGFTFL